MDTFALLLALTALAVGVGSGLAVSALRERARQAAPVVALEESETPRVPEEVNAVLGVLRSSALLVGPHDEVLEATRMARNLGLVRGSRVAVAQILDVVRLTRRDGTVRDVDVTISRGPMSTPTFLHVRVAPVSDQLLLVLADDSTAQRRIDQTRRDFVANVSHELKTPIGAISLLAEAVEEAADDPGAVRRFAGRMGIESARLSDLVGQIIELSRLQGDNPLDQAEVVDVDEVLNDAVDRCRVDAERHDVHLAVAGARDCQVVGSARLLGVAVSNLVENAVIYSDPGARVVVAAHVEARSDDDYVEITVSDTGIGIAPADLERIFERFYRVDYARSRANGGTGLGLSIVKHIAASHGGDVTVWSRPGQGSTFTLRIPAHLAAGAHRGEGAAEPPALSGGPPGPRGIGSRSDPASGSGGRTARTTGSGAPEPAHQNVKETNR